MQLRNRTDEIAILNRSRQQLTCKKLSLSKFQPHLSHWLWPCPDFPVCGFSKKNGTFSGFAGTGSTCASDFKQVSWLNWKTGGEFGAVQIGEGCGVSLDFDCVENITDVRDWFDLVSLLGSAHNPIIKANWRLMSSLKKCFTQVQDHLFLEFKH